MFLRKVVFAITVAAILVASGCHILGGGGWLPGLNGGKAHFGFDAQCVEDDGGLAFHEGEFQFMDKSAGVRFHGEFTFMNSVFGWEGTCDELVDTLVDLEIVQPNIVMLEGTCRTQPKGYEGTFTVTVEDNGTPGMLGDYIEISTEGCGDNGGDYVHSGYLGGGNIWIE